LNNIGRPRKPAKLCEVEGCPNKAKFALFRTNPDGKGVWLKVCPHHELEIGGDNMRRAGGRYEKGA